MTCVEKRGIFFWVVFCRLGGKSWDGKEKEKKKEKETIGRVVIY